MSNGIEGIICDDFGGWLCYETESLARQRGEMRDLVVTFGMRWMGLRQVRKRWANKVPKGGCRREDGIVDIRGF